MEYSHLFATKHYRKKSKSNTYVGEVQMFGWLFLIDPKSKQPIIPRESHPLFALPQGLGRSLACHLPSTVHSSCGLGMAWGSGGHLRGYHLRLCVSNK